VVTVYYDNADAGAYSGRVGGFLTPKILGNFFQFARVFKKNPNPSKFSRPYKNNLNPPLDFWIRPCVGVRVDKFVFIQDVKHTLDLHSADNHRINFATKYKHFSSKH